MEAEGRRYRPGFLALLLETMGGTADAASFERARRLSPEDAERRWLASLDAGARRPGVRRVTIRSGGRSRSGTATRGSTPTRSPGRRGRGRPRPRRGRGRHADRARVVVARVADPRAARRPRGRRSGEDLLLAARVAGAVALRRRLFPDPEATDAYRLVHSEGDGLPGLVVDRYGPVLVAQFATRPAHRRREALGRLLLAATGARSLVARAAREGGGGGDRRGGGGVRPRRARARDGPLAGGGRPVRGRPLAAGRRPGTSPTSARTAGTSPPSRRGAACSTCSRAPAGSRSRALLAGAASASAVDSSAGAVAAARRNAASNGVAARLEAVESDVDERLDALSREKAFFRRRGRRPAARSPRTGKGLAKACAYRRLAARAMARVRRRLPRDVSCSGAVSPEAFRRGRARRGATSAGARPRSCGCCRPARTIPSTSGRRGPLPDGLLLRVRGEPVRRRRDRKVVAYGLSIASDRAALRVLSRLRTGTLAVGRPGDYAALAIVAVASSGAAAKRVRARRGGSRPPVRSSRQFPRRQ